MFMESTSSDLVRALTQALHAQNDALKALNLLPYGMHRDDDHVFDPLNDVDVSYVLYNEGVMDASTGKRVIRHGPWLERSVKTGRFSTDTSTLAAIVEKTACHVAAAILNYRITHAALMAAHKATGG
jgi:hypothetical protein